MTMDDNKIIEKEPLKSPIKIGAVGVFNNDFSSSIFFSNGFEKLDSVSSVIRYDYRENLKRRINIASDLLDLSRGVDLVIIMKGSGIPLQAIKLCSKQCSTLFWMMDIYSHFTRNQRLLENSLFCDYRTATGYGTCKLWGERIKLPVHHILDGSDTSIYYPTKTRKSYDVTFIGGTDRERDAVYNFIKNRYKVKFFGPKYSRRFIRPDEFRQICNSSKIVLNISRGKLEGYSSLRLWNLLACGSMVMTKHIPNMRERMGLEADKNIVDFSNFLELQRKLDYYLEHSDKREEVEKEGLEFLRNNRTWKHTAGEIVDLVTNKPGKSFMPDITSLIIPLKKRPTNRRIFPKRRTPGIRKRKIKTSLKRQTNDVPKKPETSPGISRRVKAGWVTAA